jgi:hypothetical protein
VLHQVAAAALANLQQQQLSARMPQKADHLPLPVCLAAAAADVLGGQAGGAACSSSVTQQQQQQDGSSGWSVALSSSIVGKPVWLCFGQLVVDWLGYLPADAVTLTAAADTMAATAAGAMGSVSPGLPVETNGGQAQTDLPVCLDDSLLSCLAVCCSGGGVFKQGGLMG